jgi:NADPH-dependent curcumin reductase CurA
MSTKVSNNGVIYTKVPEGLPVINEHFKFVEREIDLSSIVLEKNEILVKNLYMSLDPYMRGRMRPSNVKSYNKPFVLEKVLEAGCTSVVVKSNSDQWKEGDFYCGISGK